MANEEAEAERPQRSLQHIRFVGSKVKRWTGDPLGCQPLQHFVGCFVKFFSPWKKFLSLSPSLFVFFTPCPKVSCFSPLLVLLFFPAAALTMKFLTADCLLFNVILPVQCEFK